MLIKVYNSGVCKRFGLSSASSWAEHGPGVDDLFPRNGLIEEVRVPKGEIRDRDVVGFGRQGDVDGRIREGGTCPVGEEGALDDLTTFR